MSCISSNISQSSVFSSNINESFKEAAKLVTGALMSSSSVSPVTMKSENEVKLQLPEDSDPDSFATPSPPKKNRVSTREPCLICSKNDNQKFSSEDDPLCQELELFQFPGASGSDLLNQQMWSTFVLRKLLKLPLSKFSDILKTAGSSIHPHQWFSLCRECSEMVNSIAESEVTIKLLQEKVKTITGTIKRKLQDSLETEARKSRRKDKDNFFVIRSEIRKSLNIKEKIPARKAPGHIVTSSMPTTLKESRPVLVTIVEEPLLEPKPEVDPFDDNMNEPPINCDITRQRDYDQDDDDDNSEDSSPPSPLPLEATDSDEEWIPNPSTPKSNFWSRSGSNWKRSRESRDPLADHNEDEDANYDQGEQEESYFEVEDETETDQSLRKCFKKRMDHLKPARLKCDKFEPIAEGQDQALKCRICNFSSKRSATLKSHMSRKHKVTEEKLDDIGNDHDDDEDAVHSVENYDLDDDYEPTTECSEAEKLTKSKVNVKRASGSRLKARRKKRKNAESLESKNAYNDDAVTVETSENASTTKEKRFKCELCDSTFKNKTALTSHTNNKHKGKKSGKKKPIGVFVCDKCGFDCGTQHWLTKHIFNHKIYDDSVDPSVSSTDFVCNLCQKTMATRHMLYRHKVQHHYEELDLPIQKCDECPKVFRAKHQLTHHVQITHRKLGKFNCDQCGFATMSEAALDRHMRRHSETVEKFVCEFCSASYVYESKLNEHLQRYHLEKYQPRRVQGVYSGVSVQKLQSEEKIGLFKRVRGQGEKMKPVNCKYCEEVLPHSLALKMHLNSVHQDLYVHKCDVDDCGRTYMSLQSLKLHKKINHGGQKEVKCGWCLKKFISKVYLYNHNHSCPKRPKNGENVPKIFIAGDELPDESQIK